MSDVILQLQGITKDYKVADSKVHALRGIDLCFRKNEFVSVLGPSGCGKTTLLNIIGGLDRYTDGDMFVKGVSTKDFKDGDWDAYRNHSIGFVFQSYNLIPHQTILGNVELALTLSGVTASERRERAKQALERVGLGKECNKKPNQLSGGQMQRVAIARALVNNPEILLADEPTGALDTETSIQIMDLIREIARERLVIMVTHNPEIADRYSTRIVRLLDGQVTDDSDPCSPPARDAAAPPPPADKAERRRIKKVRGKTSMSFLTALALSGRNLLTKKGRTAVTSIAGSIGIISVCLVLALSSGFHNYISRTEEDMLSYYPVEINETAFDMTQAMTSFMSGSNELDLDEIGDKVYVNSFLSQLAQGMTTSNDLSGGNVAQIGGEQVSYLDYVAQMPEEYYFAIQYGYGISLAENLYTDVTIGSETSKVPETQAHLSLTSLREYYTAVLTTASEKYSSLVNFVHYFTNVVNVMPGTADYADESYGSYVLSQYDVIGQFPQQSGQAVLVVGQDNDMTDLTLAQLGFLDEDDFLSLFLDAQDGDAEPYSIPLYDETDANGNVIKEGVIGRKFTLYYNDALFTPNTEGEYGYEYSGYRFNEDIPSAPVAEEDGVEIEIVGVLRLKDGLTYGCLESGLNLTEKQRSEYMEQNKQSAVVRSVQEGGGETGTGWLESLVGTRPITKWLEEYYKAYYLAVGQGQDPSSVQVPDPDSVALKSFYSAEAGGSLTEETVLRSLGGNDAPNAVSLYARDFDSKEGMLAYLDGWNSIVEQARLDWYDNHDQSYAGYDGPTEITYTDTVGILMGMVQTMLDAITYVLVAFTGISLVVSTVMIGVITYVSVVERTKEIGILRSIGARKKDIRRVFRAETFIIGMCSGVFGVVVAYLLQVVLNLILTPVTGIAGLAALPALSAAVMVVISIVLTLVSGVIPASAAAKRDPVVALRSE